MRYKNWVKYDVSMINGNKRSEFANLELRKINEVSKCYWEDRERDREWGIEDLGSDYSSCQIIYTPRIIFFP